MRKPAAALIAIAALAAAMPSAAAARGWSNTGPTPDAAALHYLSPGPGFRLLGTRTAGRFAVVRFSGALMEGNSHWSDALVIERFPFGWQIVGILRDACPSERGATRAERAVLAAPDHRGGDAGWCEQIGDRGPFADVVAVRSAYRDPLTAQFVRVSGDYAVLDWAYPGGGQTVFARRGGRWRSLGGSGGQMSAADVRRFGAPVRDACALMPPASYDPPAVHALCKRT
jgi:hypothetical protein